MDAAAWPRREDIVAVMPCCIAYICSPQSNPLGGPSRARRAAAADALNLCGEGVSCQNEAGGEV